MEEEEPRPRQLSSLFDEPPPVRAEVLVSRPTEERADLVFLRLLKMAESVAKQEKNFKIS